MKNNQPPSAGSAAVSPTYVYFVGETDTFCYAKTAQTVAAATSLRPKMAQKYSTLSREELGVPLANLLDNDCLGKLFATHPSEMIQARMILLLDAYIKHSPAFGAAVAAGLDSVIYTAFRTADGNHMIRICGAVRQGRLVTTAEAIALTRELIRVPLLRHLYESDGLAPSSLYHSIAPKAA
ncbi:MAG: hypothetical protein PSV13_10150 [Lacunisphaera sp.]|nr:hypothetical protein [Lacunisphaera sp.]